MWLGYILEQDSAVRRPALLSFSSQMLWDACGLLDCLENGFRAHNDKKCSKSSPPPFSQVSGLHITFGQGRVQVVFQRDFLSSWQPCLWTSSGVWWFSRIPRIYFLLAACMLCAPAETMCSGCGGWGGDFGVPDGRVTRVSWQEASPSLTFSPRMGLYLLMQIHQMLL